jgi:hypothetical protein
VRLAALLCALALLPAPRAFAQAPARAGSLELAADVAAGKGAVDAELGTLDGGSLTRALTRAARQGRRLRLLLDPYDKDSRVQGALLEGAGPGVHVRWRHEGASRPRWMDVAGVGQLAWGPGGPSRPVSPGAEAAFGKAWASAEKDLPRFLPLRDQLEALPDPRETSPHYVSRVSGGVP